MRIKLNLPLPRKLLTDLIGCPLPPSAPDAFTVITTDSRRVQAGDLFIALRGKRRDGHEFLEEAAKKGASLIITEKPFPSAVAVNNTTATLGRLAAAHLAIRRPYIITITGSVGKTTTKEYLSAALSTGFRIHKTEENENNILGLSKTLLSRPADCEILLAELGSNSPGEIEEMAALLRPDAAVITAIGRAHLGFFLNEEAVFREKTAVLRHLSGERRVFLNRDDPRLAAISEKELHISFISEKQEADYYASDVAFGDGGAAFLLHTPKDAVACKKSIASPEALYAFLFAAALSFELRLPKEQALSVFDRPIKVRGRQEIKEIDGCTVINDCYNASPESMEAALTFLSNFKGTGRRVAILGDMAELGEAGPSLHREIGRRAAECCTHLFAFGRMSEYYIAGALEAGFPIENILTYSGAAKVAADIKKRTKISDILLIKASHSTGGELIVAALTEEKDEERA